jgi:SAM-dependent methyltransferase
MQTVELPASDGRLTCCPICHSAFEPVYQNRYSREIGRCRSCGHHFVVNPWTEAELAQFYQGIKYFSQNCRHQGIHSISQDADWEHWVAYRVATLESTCLSALPERPLDILEQGCLEGRVLDGLAKLGHHVSGCDVNAGVTQIGRACFGLDIREGTIETCSFSPGSFDLVYSFHTLEHLRDPVRNLAATKALLRPGGMVFFEIPLNETDYENRDHMHFFSCESVGCVMRALFRDFSQHQHSFTTEGGVATEAILVWATKK